MTKRLVALLLCAMFALASVSACADTRWICPKCYHPNTNSYCSECGVGRPQNTYDEGYLFKYDNAGMSSFTLKSGDSGDNVRTTQDMLNYLGYFNSTVDGQYGPKTKAAVTAYKQNNGMRGHSNNAGVMTPFAYLSLFTQVSASWASPRVTRSYTAADDQTKALNNANVQMGQYTHVLNFGIKNENYSQVLTGFAVRYWLVDSKGGIIRQNGYECYETIYYTEIDPGSSASFTLNLPDYSASSKAYAVRWIIVESAYGDGETYAQYDLSGKLTSLPYYETPIY